MWTPERVSELQRLRQLGMSDREIGRAMGLSRGQVAGKLYRLSGYRRGRTEAERIQRIRDDVANDDAIVMAALVADGRSRASVAAEFGVSIGKVNRAVELSQARHRSEVAQKGGDVVAAWGRD